MENQLPLTLPDGFKNTPERCPCPLYSRDPTQEHQEILQEDQFTQRKHIKTEAEEQPEDPYVIGQVWCKEDEIPLEISTAPGDTRDTPRDIKLEEEGTVRIKEEGVPVKISTDPKDTRDTQRDVKPGEEGERYMTINNDISIKISTDLRVTKANQKDINVGKEDSHVKAKRKILEIGMDGRYRWYNTAGHPNVYPERAIVDEEITAYVLEEKAITPNLKPSYKEEKLFECPECGQGFARKHDRIMHRRIHTGQGPYSCSECGKIFSFPCYLEQHLKTHTGQSSPFSCSECGGRFRNGRILAQHKKVHTLGKVHKCSQCGQAFMNRLNLKRHQRVHYALKPC